jgi:hypothetical protein
VEKEPGQSAGLLFSGRGLKEQMRQPPVGEFKKNSVTAHDSPREWVRDQEDIAGCANKMVGGTMGFGARG